MRACSPADAELVPARELAGVTYRGRDGFIEFMRSWTEDFEDWTIELDRAIDAPGDCLAQFFASAAQAREVECLSN